jgi:hypothetical protein
MTNQDYFWAGLLIGGSPFVFMFLYAIVGIM